MAKHVVSVENYEYGKHGNPLEDLCGHKKVVTILDDETNRVEEGYGRDEKDAAGHAMWRHEKK